MAGRGAIEARVIGDFDLAPERTKARTLVE
jgi:hypothetical protein